MPFSKPNTGVDQGGNLIKMVAILVVPFVVFFFAVQIFLPLEWSYIADVFVIIGWLMYCVMLYTNEKAKTTSYLPFPQSHWRFPDGQQINFDIQLLPADEQGFECIKRYSDGSELYRVKFKNSIAYQEKDRPFPDIFNYALWKLPANFTESFSRNGHGEFFAGTLFVDHPACENIDVAVLKWDERANYRVPVCLITACTYTYKEALKRAGQSFAPGNVMTKEDLKDAIVTDLKNTNSELIIRNNYLEDENERLNVTEPAQIQTLSTRRMAAVVTRHKSIMNIPEESRLRYFNLKTLAIALVVVLFILVTSHFAFGWP